MTDQPQPLTAGVGRHVILEIRYEGGETERLELGIVPDEAADFERGFLGEGTPLARAIQGQPGGVTLPYRVGDALEVRLMEVREGLAAEPEDLAERRKETLRKAIRESDKTNAIIFASSMNSKWGDYDPSGIQDDWE